MDLKEGIVIGALGLGLAISGCGSETPTQIETETVVVKEVPVEVEVDPKINRPIEIGDTVKVTGIITFSAHYPTEYHLNVGADKEFICFIVSDWDTGWAYFRYGKNDSITLIGKVTDIREYVDSDKDNDIFIMDNCYIPDLVEILDE